MSQNQWGDSPYEQHPSGGSKATLAIAVVAAVLSVGLLVGVIWWVFGGDTGESAASQSSTIAAPVTVTETVLADPEDSLSASESSQLPTPSLMPSSPRRASVLPSGLDTGGWTAYRDAQCNLSDTWVYAGGNSTTKVVICKVGRTGDLYYRGMRNGSGLERDVDMTSVNIGAGHFEIPAEPATIIIDGDTLIVYGTDGSLSARESFAGQAWTK